MNDPNMNEGGGLHWNSPQDLVGTVLAERYRVDGVIGDGGMGSVYEAQHVTLRKRVALKVLHPELCRDQTHVDRFLQEARAASMIDHEHIVDIVDFGPVPGGSVFFAMEFLEGEDLSGRLKREGRMPWPKVRELMLQIVGALSAAHHKGIIHRDLKPANCFVIQKRGRDYIKLLDFGIAKVTDQENDKGLTRTGAIFGTAKYMAPEQACGEPADKRTDIYAAAVVMYELLTGHVPFDGDNFMRVLSRHLTEPLTMPSTMAPDANIPPVVESIVVKALSKKREDRYQSMEELEDALEAVGPDGNLRRDLNNGPPMMAGPAGTLPLEDGPGHTMWIGNEGQGSQGPHSQPPEGPRGTILLDDHSSPLANVPSPQGQMGWGSSGAQTGGDAGGTYVMDAPAIPRGPTASPITNSPPPGGAPGLGTPTTNPPQPETRPPTRAPDPTMGDAGAYEPERSKAGFIAMIIGGAAAAIGAGGLVAWLVLGGGDEDKPEDTPTAKVASADPEPKQEINPPKEEPKLEPVIEDEPEPEPEPVIKIEDEPEPEPQPEPVNTKPPKDTPPPKNNTTKPPKDTPSKRTSKDIKRGFAKAEKAAKACMTKFGALPGQRIAVDVTINKKGLVLSANATGSNRGTPLGNCLAQAVRNKAKFKPSTEPLETTQYTFKR